MATNNCNCSCGGSGSSSQKVIKTTFLLRRGTTSAWEAANPILAYGEPGYEKDTGKLKIGDGIHAWNELPYLTDEIGANVSGDNKSITLNENGEILINGFDTAQIGQMPVVGEDGSIEWVDASNKEEFDRLEEIINQLQEKVEALKEDAASISDISIIYGGNASDLQMDKGALLSTVEVPNVVGMSLNEAIATLRASELSYALSGKADVSTDEGLVTVQSQEPAAGEQAKKLSNVQLVVVQNKLPSPNKQVTI